MKHPFAALALLAALCSGPALAVPAGTVPPPGNQFVPVACGASSAAAANVTAINAALTAGGEVRVGTQSGAPCVVYLNAPLVIASNTRLYSGPGITYRQASGGNGNLLQNAAYGQALTTVTLTWSANDPLRATISGLGSFAQGDAIYVVGTIGTTDPAYTGVFQVVDATTPTKPIVVLRRIPAGAPSGTIQAKKADQHIYIEGGVWDWNYAQNTATGPNLHVMNLVGIRDLSVKRITCTNVPKYCVDQGALANFRDEDIYAWAQDNTQPENSDTVKTYGPAFDGEVTRISGDTAAGDDQASIQTCEPAAFVLYAVSCGDVINVTLSHVDATKGYGAAIYPTNGWFIMDGIVVDDVNVHSGYMKASTLAAGASAAATSISSNASYPAGTILTLDGGQAAQESVIVSAVSGAGPYTETVSPLANSHSNGAALSGFNPVSGVRVFAAVHTEPYPTGLIRSLTIRNVEGRDTNQAPVIQVLGGDGASTMNIDRLEMDHIRGSLNPGSTIANSIISINGWTGTIKYLSLTNSRFWLPSPSNMTYGIIIGANANLHETYIADNIVDGYQDFTSYLVQQNNSGTPGKMILARNRTNNIAGLVSATNNVPAGAYYDLIGNYMLNTGVGVSLRQNATVYAADNYSNDMSLGFIRTNGTMNATFASGGGNTIPAGKLVVVPSGAGTVTCSGNAADLSIDLKSVADSGILNRSPDCIINNTNAALPSGTITVQGLVVGDHAAAGAGSWHLMTDPTKTY